MRTNRKKKSLTEYPVQTVEWCHFRTVGTDDKITPDDAYRVSATLVMEFT